jgi:hypothetical protein
MDRREDGTVQPPLRRRVSLTDQCDLHRGPACDGRGLPKADAGPAAPQAPP